MCELGVRHALHHRAIVLMIERRSRLSSSGVATNVVYGGILCVLLGGNHFESRPCPE